MLVVVEYKLAKKGKWLPTGIITHPSEAWHRWVSWRLAEGVADYYAVQVRDADEECSNG